VRNASLVRARDGTSGVASTAYCEELGGTVNLDTGVCTLPDGTQIDEWELYNRDNPS